MSTVALDTNILVKAFRDQDAAGDALRAVLASASARGTEFAVPVFCVGELWRIVTDRRAPGRIPPRRVLAWIDRLLSEGATLLSPGPRYWALLRALLADGLPEGLGVFDCQIAAVCQEYGIEHIWTFDRAFVRYAPVRAVDPLNDRLQK
jgi:predicted nucleic acid-binding protein